MSHFSKWWKHKSDVMLHIKDTTVRHQPPVITDSAAPWATSTMNNPLSGRHLYTKIAQKQEITAHAHISHNTKIKLNKNHKLCSISYISLPPLQSLYTLLTCSISCMSFLPPLASFPSTFFLSFSQQSLLSFNSLRGGLGAAFLPNDALLRGKKFDSWRPLLALSYSCTHTAETGEHGQGCGSLWHNKYPHKLVSVSPDAKPRPTVDRQR